MTPPRAARALLVAVGALLLVATGTAPALADTPDSPDAPAVVALDAAGSGVDDFEFASFNAVYELSRDDSGRSRLHTVETLVAVFPEYDQNRGIRRALVSDYKGHSTNIDIVSVTDGNGVPRSFDRSVEGEFTTLTIAVPQGQYVHGEQTYVIEYTRSDVTSTETDLADGVTRDEFYWDTNGTGWAQPFREVSATVRVHADLVPALTGEAVCYYGYDGTSDRCDVEGGGDSDGQFSATVHDLFPYQNMTLVVSFAEGTFAGAPFWTFVPIVALVAIALVLFGLIAALVIRFVFWRDARGRGIVIAQYEPPAGLGMMLAANIIGAPKKGMAATIVDLAVQKNLRLLEHDQGWSKVFGVQKLSSADLAPDEQRVMGALFSVNPFAVGGVLPGLKNLFGVGGSTPQPIADEGGEVRWLTKGDTALGQQVVALTKSVEREAEAGGLRRKPSKRPLLLAVGPMVIAGLLLLGMAIFGGDEDEKSIIISVVGLNAVPWITIFAVGLLARRRPLTSKGAELREHLEGLREFIRLAEADRLQMLQSVSGAERVSTSDRTAIVKIYEKLLPYAVIFGLEKQWAQELAKYYDTDPPDWYSGSTGFHIGAFSAGLASLSSNVSTSYSGSSGSSSSGGGGGGGSSGGGGGGGGGGGV